MKAGVPVGDFTAGLYAAYTIAALLPQVRPDRARRCGSTARCSTACSASRRCRPASTGASGREPQRLGTAHPRNAPYQGFAAADGDFTVAAGNDRLWAAVAEVAGLPELVEDPRFVTQSDRVAHQHELAALLQERFAEEKREHWLTELRARGVPCGPVNTFGEILADPHVEADRAGRPHRRCRSPARCRRWSSRCGSRARRRGSTAARPALGADAEVVRRVGDRMSAASSTAAPVWTVTLDRPARANALSAELVEALHGVLDEADGGRGRWRWCCAATRGTSRPASTSAGSTQETDATLAHRFLRIGLLLERLVAAPYLTVAVVEGAAVGAGADLVLACDHRLVGARR